MTQKKFENIRLEELSLVIDFLLDKIYQHKLNCVLLFGDLGYGKTSLVQEFAKKIGIEKKLASPSFVIMKEYPIEAENGFKKLVHIDAYRLKGKDDIKVFDLDKLLDDKENLIFVEWPDKIGLQDLKDCLKVFIESESSSARSYTVEYQVANE